MQGVKRRRRRHTATQLLPLASRIYAKAALVQIAHGFGKRLLSADPLMWLVYAKVYPIRKILQKCANEFELFIRKIVRIIVISTMTNHRQIEQLFCGGMTCGVFL
jgi:hypothetical protein